MSIYMEQTSILSLPTAILRKICTLLVVREVLAIELAVRHQATPLAELHERFGKEPLENTYRFFKKGRLVTYNFLSYYDNDRLYTRVHSHYSGRNVPVISVVTHKVCRTTSEANMWSLYIFTQQPASRAIRELSRRHNIPTLLQIHS